MAAAQQTSRRPYLVRAMHEWMTDEQPDAAPRRGRRAVAGAEVPTRLRPRRAHHAECRAGRRRRASSSATSGSNSPRASAASRSTSAIPVVVRARHLRARDRPGHAVPGRGRIAAAGARGAGDNPAAARSSASSSSRAFGRNVETSRLHCTPRGHRDSGRPDCRPRPAAGHSGSASSVAASSAQRSRCSLAETGAAVTVFEKTGPAMGATRNSFAWLNAFVADPHYRATAGSRAWRPTATSTGNWDSESSGAAT